MINNSLIPSYLISCHSERSEESVTNHISQLQSSLDKIANRSFLRQDDIILLHEPIDKA
jgi:hypothetical protein